MPEGAEEGIHPRPPSPRSPERRRWRPSNLTLRLITALILVPPVVWVCYTGGLAFVAVVIAFNLIAINEFYSFISQKGVLPHRLLGTLAAGVLPLIVYLGDAFLATSFMTAVLLTVMVLQLTKSELRESISSVSATFFGIFYVGWLLSHAVSVRFIHEDLRARYGVLLEGHLDPQMGFFFMILCLSAAVLSDAGAYFVGRRYGRHKLAPAISPNKTIEGALGGILVGALGAAVVKVIFDQIPLQASRELSFRTALLFGVVIASVATLGDLVESVLKRDAALKDAGRILPGVGGVLDRIDSALLAIPVMYYLLLTYYYVRFVA
ncbi:MAG: phosphatidate cytidylyltransferase [Myxococcota bacterium]